MAGLSPKLPVVQDPVDGFALTKTYREAIAQNFKNLMLTSPGERIMDPDFGVGLRRFLFEQSTPLLIADIEERINSQVATYLPFLEILNVFINTPDQEEYSNELQVRVEYLVVPLGVADAFEQEIRDR
tara:strand:- start:349 stop:732 length:384 start_codon:yes stop_codon:yes gene_type:complete